MSRRGNAAPAGEGYMRGAWDWATSLGALREGAVRVSLWPTTRAGVFRVVVALVEVVDGSARGCKAKVEAEWPNAEYATLEGLIFRLVVNLDALMEVNPLQQAK